MHQCHHCTKNFIRELKERFWSPRIRLLAYSRRFSKHLLTNGKSKSTSRLPTFDIVRKEPTICVHWLCPKFRFVVSLFCLVAFVLPNFWFPFFSKRSGLIQLYENMSPHYANDYAHLLMRFQPSPCVTVHEANE